MFRVVDAQAVDVASVFGEGYCRLALLGHARRARPHRAPDLPALTPAADFAGEFFDLSSEHHALKSGNDQLQVLDLAVPTKELLAAPPPALRASLDPVGSDQQHWHAHQPWHGVCHSYVAVIDQNVCAYPADGGSHVLCGRRQSMPSKSIDNCARVNDTIPFVARGQMKRPRSNLFRKRQRPSPSDHGNLIKSPRLT